VHRGHGSAIIAKQIVEVFGLRRSCVEVTMPGGRVIQETVHSFPLEIVPLPTVSLPGLLLNETTTSTCSGS
jgi:hypothetical protein